jgi:hypothetical protein
MTQSTISGHAGSLMASASPSRGTNRGVGCDFMRRMFLVRGKPRAISPEAVNAAAFVISPDGQLVVGIGSDQKGYFYPSAGGEPRIVNGLEPGDLPISWNQNDRSIYLYRTDEVPAKVYQLELATGKKTVCKQIVPVDPTGVSTIGPILMTPDGKTYVYGFHRTLGDLYLAEGLK